MLILAKYGIDYSLKKLCTKIPSLQILIFERNLVIRKDNLCVQILLKPNKL